MVLRSQPRQSSLAGPGSRVSCCEGEGKGWAKRAGWMRLAGRTYTIQEARLRAYRTNGRYRAKPRSCRCVRQRVYERVTLTGERVSADVHRGTHRDGQTDRQKGSDSNIPGERRHSFDVKRISLLRQLVQWMQDDVTSIIMRYVRHAAFCYIVRLQCRALFDRIICWPIIDLFVSTVCALYLKADSAYRPNAFVYSYMVNNWRSFLCDVETWRCWRRSIYTRFTRFLLHVKSKVIYFVDIILHFDFWLSSML